MNRIELTKSVEFKFAYMSRDPSLIQNMECAVHSRGSEGRRGGIAIIENIVRH
jgi:hypothetical protein